MLKLIKIKDSINGNFLSVTLKNLLEVIKPYVKSLSWAIYELDVLVKQGGIPGYSELIKKIDNAKSGYAISWEDVNSLADKVDQTINLILVACDNADSFIPYTNTTKWKRSYDVVIEIVDGDYWEVYTSDEKLVSLLESKYSDTEISAVN